MNSWFPDPTDWLRDELAELRGFVKKVPPLIQAERDARWKEIATSPGDPDGPDMIDVYEHMSGPEEGYGHADWEGLTYRTAIVTGWELFRSTMSDLLEGFLREGTSSIPQYAADLLEEELRSFDRRFDQLVKRYREWAGLDLKQLAEWPAVRHTQELRNAIVHHQGIYTERYAKEALAIPCESFGRSLSPDEAFELKERIPLTAQHVTDALDILETVAMRARTHLDPNSNGD